MLSSLKITTLGVTALLLSGCAMEPATTDDTSETTGSVSQAFIDLSWTSNGIAALGRGMSMNVNGVTFLWTSLSLAQDTRFGYLCTGNNMLAPCANPIQFYQTPFPPSKLRGVAISRTNGLVYSYFDNGFAAEGIATNLASRRIMSFTVPAGLSSSQLVEVEQSTGGTWHFWWKKADGVMVHTTSRSPTDGGLVKAANVPYVPFPWVINGVLIYDTQPNTVYTYYSANNGQRGVVNLSMTASNLHEL